MKRKWMPEEESTLIAMVEAGAENAEIAKKLNRSIAAVAHKRARLYADIESCSNASTSYQFVEEQSVDNDDEFSSINDAFAKVSEQIAGIKTALDDRLAASSEELENLHNLCDDNTRILNCLLDYLNHSWLWRMFHRVGTCRSQEGYMDKPIEEG